MSRGSFVFTPTALRSLQQDEDMLRRYEVKRRLASRLLPAGYALRKEARDGAPPPPPRSGPAPPAALCRDAVVHNALYTGNLETLQQLFPRGSRASLIVEPRGGDMRWVATGEGLWSLSYEQELTTPLHITASRGFAECLRLLLQRGADVELAPGGITALHEACESCQPECAKLLLSHGANANAVSEDGYMPLHYCTHGESLECAKYLLQYGAAVGGCSADEGDTPLHVAARNGLPDHVDLYLRYGASVDKPNAEGVTPLNAACAQHQEQGDLQRYFEVCQTLVGAGADVHVGDQDRRSPLHMSCKNVNPDVVDLLLANGASVNDMDYGGEAPMHNVLKVACYKVSHRPERIVRALLNHGSIRVWPGALPMVLKHCSTSPRTIEVLLNAYSHLKVTDTWAESVPPEVLKVTPLSVKTLGFEPRNITRIAYFEQLTNNEHKEFYDSIFSLALTPRSLQHLARCKLRDILQERVHEVVPKLDLPTFIKSYLLLEYRGYIH